MGPQEGLDGLELVRDAFDVVETVDAQQDFLAVEPALQVDDLILDVRRLQRGLEARRLDADRECIDRDRTARSVIKYTLWRRR